MEGYQIQFSGIRRLFSDYATESRFNWQNPSSVQILCPEPRRSGSNFCGSEPVHKADFGVDIVDLILTEDLESDSEEEDNFFFCKSPPLRTNNPLIHDPQFLSIEDFHGIQRNPNSSCAPSFAPNPTLRIEGFSCGNSTCGNSDNRHVLSALA